VIATALVEMASVEIYVDFFGSNSAPGPIHRLATGFFRKFSG
jgi:hypothetical protein